VLGTPVSQDLDLFEKAATCCSDFSLRFIPRRVRPEVTLEARPFGEAKGVSSEGSAAEPAETVLGATMVWQDAFLIAVAHPVAADHEG